MKAINFDTDEMVDVVPFGLFSPDFSSLYLEDDIADVLMATDLS